MVDVTDSDGDEWSLVAQAREPRAQNAPSLAVGGRGWQARSKHPTVEKTVRVLCDYYRKVTSQSPPAEAELFWRGRQDVTTRVR